jgi:hypothetical protein
MMAKKSRKRGGGGEGDPRVLLGSVLAVRHATGQLERVAAKAIWDTPASRRTKLAVCIMDAIKKCQATIVKCGDKETGGGSPGGGSGPACPPGFHEEFDICVPDPPDEDLNPNS